MFVRNKKRSTGNFYYLVENYRHEGKTRQRVLFYLARFPTVEAALASYAKSIPMHHRLREELLESAETSANPESLLAWAQRRLEWAEELEAKQKKLLELQARA